MRLIDKDELIKKYDEVHVGPPGGARKLMVDAPVVNEWISVLDKLPEVAGYECLVTAVNTYGQHRVFIAFTGYGDFKWYTMDATKMEKAKDGNNEVSKSWMITHWMHLPEAEKEVKTDEHL